MVVHARALRAYKVTGPRVSTCRQGGRGGWKRSRSRELNMVPPLKVSFSNRSTQVGDYTCYWIGKSLVTHNAQSTLS